MELINWIHPLAALQAASAITKWQDPDEIL